jgi:hypothetical protein
MSGPTKPSVGEDGGKDVVVVEHEGVVTSDAPGRSDSERDFLRWMEDTDPEPEDDEASDASTDDGVADADR